MEMGTKCSHHSKLRLAREAGFSSVSFSDKVWQLRSLVPREMLVVRMKCL